MKPKARTNLKSRPALFDNTWKFVSKITHSTVFGWQGNSPTKVA